MANKENVEGKFPLKAVLTLFVTASLFVLEIVSCNPEMSQPTVAVTGVTLSPESLDIEIGDQKPLTATVSPDNATNKNVSFSSSKEAVATVSQDGIVDAMAAGKAIVTVTTEDGKFKAHCTINVLDKVVHVTGIVLNKATLSLKEGEEFTLVPTVTPDNASDKTVNWSSDNEAVVTITSDGVVSALKAGKATVTATTVDQGKTASCSIEVAEGIGAFTGTATHISCRSAEIAGKANLPSMTSPDLTFGILYSTSSDVLFGPATKIEPRSFDSEYNYSVNTEVLEPETTYYYRSFISQSDEIIYGDQKFFKTLAVSSMIQTLDATEINPKDAVLNAMLDLTDCKYDGLEYGFVVTPEGGSAHTIKSSNLSEKKFSVKDETLSRMTKYSVVAYVKLDGRIYKGETKEFTTTNVQISITAEASDASYHSATISGKFTVESEGNFTKSAILYYDIKRSNLYNNPMYKEVSLDSDATYYIVADGMSINTKYYYIVCFNVDGETLGSSEGTLTTLDYQTPELVDLGLSVKWATFNLGASKPEEYGGYYRWAGKEDVTDGNIDFGKLDRSIYYVGLTLGWTKYVPSDEPSYWYGSGNPDNKTTLDLEDDVAHVTLGGKWRMPTYAEWKELRNNCSSKWTTLNGIKGRIFTSKKNGNSIFLPSAGYRNGNLDYVEVGFYWSSSLFEDPDYAYTLETELYGAYSSRERVAGLSVRPVSE